ncbi:MAG: 3'-5' exonuclease [Kiritimatiellae bacterium]|nr:3'-5' exonuclease [Kiritimatiellia bacterium]
MIPKDHHTPSPALFSLDALDANDFPAAPEPAAASQPQPSASAPAAPEGPPPALPESLVLDRPIVFFDIEATGLDTGTDRILSIALVKYEPPARHLPPQTRTYLLNPERSIPPESTKIHGITDEDVRLCPTFDRIADELYALLEDADLGGYNVSHFDIPILQREFQRAGRTFSTDGRRIVDPQSIFFMKEPRTLSAAVKFYCGHELDGAHNSQSDIYATVEVLAGQFKKYDDLPTDMAALDDYCVQRKPDWIDRTGRLRWQNGEAVFNFGKNKGRTLRDIVRSEPGFISWMLKGDFSEDLKQIVRSARDKGIYPTPGKA